MKYKKVIKHGMMDVNHVTSIVNEEALAQDEGGIIWVTLKLDSDL